MFGWSSTHILPLGLLSLFATSALAQNEPRRPDPARPATTPATIPATTPATTPGMGQTSTGADGILAAWLLVDNENEIALAQFAQDRAKSDEVKQFAKKMVDDHRQMATKLQKVSGTSTGMTDSSMPGRGTPTDSSTRKDGTGTTGQQPERTGERQPGTTPQGERPVGGIPGQPSGMGQTGQAGGLNVVAIKRDLGRECLASSKRGLESKNGADFDKCYIHHVVMAHQGCVDTINVFKNHASNDLRQALTEVLPTVQAHLEHAKSICQKLDTGSEASRRGEKSDDNKK